MGADTNATFSSQFKPEGWYVLKFDKRNFCTFVGECDIEHNISGIPLCHFCMHREPLDIPKMIYEVKKRKQERREKEDG